MFYIYLFSVSLCLSVASRYLSGCNWENQSSEAIGWEPLWRQCYLHAQPSTGAGIMGVRVGGDRGLTSLVSAFGCQKVQLNQRHYQSLCLCQWKARAMGSYRSSVNVTKSAGSIICMQPGEWPILVIISRVNQICSVAWPLNLFWVVLIELVTFLDPFWIVFLTQPLESATKTTMARPEPQQL